MIGFCTCLTTMRTLGMSWAELNLAEELVFAALKAGKLRLLARASDQDPKDPETEGLRLIDPVDIRRGIFDRWEGEIVLIVSGTESKSDIDENELELVDLHLYDDDFSAFVDDVVTYRTADSAEAPADATSRESEEHSSGGEVRVGTASAEFECAKWFRQQVDGCEDGPGKELLWKQAREQFGAKLSKRAFVRVWDSNAPQEWKTAGRKPSR